MVKVVADLVGNLVDNLVINLVDSNFDNAVRTCCGERPVRFDRSALDVATRPFLSALAESHVYNPIASMESRLSSMAFGIIVNPFLISRKVLRMFYV